MTWELDPNGKTEIGACKLARLLFNNDPPADLCKFFIVSETIEMACNIWAEKLQYYFKKEHIQKIEYQSSAQELPRTVIFQPSKNKKRWQLVFRSYNQGRATFQGFSKVMGFWCDEQIPFDILNELDTRVREYGIPGTKWLTLTPVAPDPELEERFNNPSQYPDWQFYRLNSERNYKFGGIKNISWLANTPDDLRETRRIGAFANISGAVFKEWNSKIHVIAPIELPRACEIYRVIDPGFEHTTACIWAAKDDVGRWYVFAEWGRSGLLIQDKVDSIQNTFKWKDKDPRYHTYCDGAAAQERAEYNKLGLTSSIAKKEPVTWSIELVRRAMQIQADGKPNLLIFDNCVELIRQIKNYRWMPAPKHGFNKASIQKPVKDDDDFVDCLRMLILSTHQGSIKSWDAVKVPPRAGFAF